MRIDNSLTVMNFIVLLLQLIVQNVFRNMPNKKYQVKWVPAHLHTTHDLLIKTGVLQITLSAKSMALHCPDLNANTDHLNK